MESEVQTDKNRDLKEMLGQIEQKIDLISLNYSVLNLNSVVGKNDEEINLRELWLIIWAGKFKIVAITVIFAITSVFYALSLPNMYKSEAILAPAQDDSQGGLGGLGGLAASYGGLAAMAGINLGGGGSSRIDQAVELVKSWPFLGSFINKYKLKPQIMAVQGWNRNTNELIYNYDIYNPETQAWVSGAEVKSSETPEPSDFKAFKTLSQMLTISTDHNTGMLTISIEHFSPQLAFEWVGLLIQELNSFYQRQDMAEAQRNIDYLEAKIAETSVADMQSVFYGMIEGQIQTLMLAEVSEQYLVKTVVPAKIPELKSKPSRATICVIGAVFGGMLSLLFVLISHFVRKY